MLQSPFLPAKLVHVGTVMENISTCMPNRQIICDHNKTKLNQMKLEQVQINKELEELRN